MNVTVVGLGYVGLSLAVLLSGRHNVTAVDISRERVDAVNGRRCPLQDAMLSEYLSGKPLRLTAVTPDATDYGVADFVLVAVPTDYDPALQHFDTAAVEQVVRSVRAVSGAPVVIKSTVPVGFTDTLRREVGGSVLFSPEFLREGHALRDNLYPSRIVVGADLADEASKSAAERFAEILRECALSEEVPVRVMGAAEAEAVKLFANTYLAMRVAFFNELDTYADVKGLNTGDIIGGVCLDSRVGAYYNNPSFGYGGYCLPKDTKQLAANFEGVPNDLIGAVVASNHTRKDFIAADILRRAGDLSTAVIGVYRLTMKAESDNFRSSATIGIIRRLRAAGARLVIYEPALRAGEFEGVPVLADLDRFFAASTLILANRLVPALAPARDRVYTRDLFLRDD